MPTTMTPTTAIPRGVRVTGDERRKLGTDLAARYNGGASIRELAADIGRSYGFVNRLLREEGVALRRRGGPRRIAQRQPGAKTRRVQ